MAKQLRYSEDVRKKIFSGVEQLSQAVAATLGPKGRNVLIERAYGAPLITKDGVTVAKEVVLEDPFENIGAQVIKEAATKTNDLAGDGTTTATVLAYAIAREGMKLVAAGHDPMEIKQGIDDAVDIAVQSLSAIKKPVKTKEDIFHIAAISANGDETLGKEIADAMNTIGKDGVITVEESRTFNTYVSYVEGMQFDKGYMSPYFSTEENMTAILNEPLLFLIDKAITSIQSIVPILEMAQRLDKPIMILCDGVSNEVLQALVMNKLQGRLRVCVSTSPGFGDRRKEMIQDIAILTGGTVLSEDIGLTIDKFKPEYFGKCASIKVSMKDTVIVDGHGDPKKIKERISQLRNQVMEAETDFEKEKFQERLAKLSGGVAVIYVGAATEVALKEKKHRVEDSLSAIRAALEEGIVPGGGIAYLRAAQALSIAMTELGTEGIQPGILVGYDIVLKALEEPLYQIVKNGGGKGDIVVERAKASKGSKGYDASKKTWVDMFDVGIIDPVKVTRLALQHAASVAGLLLTTECAMIELPSKQEQPMVQG